MNYKIINFKVRGDERGSLVALEENMEIPFEVRRVYYVYGTDKEVVRGKHSHKNLKQVIICVSGSCDFILDDGKNKQQVHLNSPNQGLYLESNIWRTFTHFSHDCVVLVLASEHYDEGDYIRNYDDFLASVK